MNATKARTTSAISNPALPVTNPESPPDPAIGGEGGGLDGGGVTMTTVVGGVTVVGVVGVGVDVLGVFVGVGVVSRKKRCAPAALHGGAYTKMFMYEPLNAGTVIRTFTCP